MWKGPQAAGIEDLFIDLPPALPLLPAPFPAFVFIWTWSLVPGTVVGVVLYTGRELRSVMNTSDPRSKVGGLQLTWVCVDDGQVVRDWVLKLPCTNWLSNERDGVGGEGRKRESVA